ncbi:MAG: hypothetical protein PHW62_00625 [Candidatus Ratteibacteria bacterium]|nr:hypothetical protein [Candidatus Ratteibacteria bacterium]
MSNQKKKLWLPKLKTGALSRMLQIPEEKDIPMGLLTKIKKAPVGTEVTNPYPIGIRIIHVTPLLKKRAVLAHTLKKMKRRK